MDPVEKLKKMIGDAGEVKSVYGGFEIRVSKPDVFPWHKLIDHLIGIGQHVWVKKEKKKIYIVSEPKVP